MSGLSKIIKKAKTWGDIYQELKSHNAKDDSSAGLLFEEFCKLYYLLEPSVAGEYKNVWLFSELPPRVRKKLNLSTVEHGIDLVLEDKESQLHVVQCKFRNNQSSTLSWSKDKLANIYAEGDKADHFIIFTNASGLDKHTITKKESQLTLVSLGDLLEISPETIKNFRLYLKKKVKPKPKIKKPRAYQRKAINAVVKGLEDSERGQLILPCGAGKTLISLWIQQSLKVKSTLVLVPSLALLRQIKKEWAENGQDLPYLCVCSEKDIDKGRDSVVTHTYEIPGNVTTSPDEIKRFVSHHKKFIIYSTYQSLDSIAKAIKPIKYSFDLAICDEAHKTAGSKKGKFALIHDNKKVPVKKRLYMTATPRIISNRARSKIKEEELEYLCDMDDPNTFGPELHRMTFKEAIEKKILVDYKIVAIGVDDKELQREIKKKRYVNEDFTIDQIANNFAIEKFMAKYNAKHSITFHSSIKKANDFKGRHEELFPRQDVFHVNGGMSTNLRNVHLNDFKNSDKSIITNSRCLTEGVDVPAIDAVYFCDPKNSIIDIVQATGRALRRADAHGKELGYVVVPIFHSKGEDLEQAVDSNDFKNLIQIVKALATQDERITDYIKKIKLGEKGDMQDLEEDPLIVGHEKIMIDLVEGRLKDKIFDQVIEKTPVPWRDFKDARDFVRMLNLQNQQDWTNYVKSGNKPKDIPYHPERSYKNNGWISYGDWLGTGRVASQNYDYLDYNEAEKFVHALGILNQQGWYEYCKSGKKPKQIPTYPYQTYKDKGWKSWGEWLGTNFVANFNKEFRSYIEARDFVHQLGLRSHKEWLQFKRSRSFPSDIPKAPDQTYRDQGWHSWGDWLGTGRTSNEGREFREFEKARKFVQSLNLKSLAEWRKFTKSNARPSDIPTNPDKVYNDKGWRSYGDWLGTNTVAPFNIKYRDFIEARNYVQSLNIKNIAAWRKYCKSNQKPVDIPATPWRVYKNDGWVSLGDWLGSKSIAAKDRIYLDFKKARKFVRSLNLKGTKQWSEYCKSDKKPINIPAAPHQVYKDQGWIDYSDWLGSGSKSKRYSSFREFNQARKFVHSLKLKRQIEWKNYCKSGIKPIDIPSDPYGAYKGKGWISWGDWLGTDSKANKDVQFKDFNSARSYAHTLRLTNREAWREYCKQGYKPDDIPSNPDRTYKGKGWTSWNDWLGKE